MIKRGRNMIQEKDVREWSIPWTLRVRRMPAAKQQGHGKFKARPAEHCNLMAGVNLEMGSAISKHVALGESGAPRE